jgi:co-chaperonin GroES (HSP10)
MTQNAENLNNDLVLTTGSNKNKTLALVGDRIVIQLDEAQDHTITEGGVIVTLNELMETDGGRVTTRTSSKRHLSQGTILAISPDAYSKCGLSKGDRVYVTSHANSPQYQFFLNRDNLVQDFEGIISIPHILIEAKIN